jgi:hypothetical protein
MEVTMKCIKDGVSGEIRRVPNEEAEHKVRSYPAIWRYCSKSEWKAARNKVQS